MIPEGALQVIAAAVTPVVLLSALALLIVGISSKHDSLAAKIRVLTAEYRAPGTSAERRENVRQQVELLCRRATFAATAHLWLYLAVVCFVATILAIALSPRGQVWEPTALTLFVVGVLLTLGAIVAEVLELRLSGRTVRLEVQDILPEPVRRRGLVRLTRGRARPTGRRGIQP